MLFGKGTTIYSRRLTLLVVCLVVAVTVIAGRLVYYQIFMHDDLQEWYHEQRTWEKTIPAERGDITDINGNPNTYTVLQFTGGNHEFYNIFIYGYNYSI